MDCPHGASVDLEVVHVEFEGGPALALCAKECGALVRRRIAAIQVKPHGMLSRGISGIAGMTLIVNFPGSPAAVREGFPVIAPTLAHAVRTLRGDSRHGARD